MASFKLFIPKNIDRIDSADDDDLEYWQHHFGISKEELETAVAAVGDDFAAVAKYFLRRSCWVDGKPPLETYL